MSTPTAISGAPASCAERPLGLGGAASTCVRPAALLLAAALLMLLAGCGGEGGGEPKQMAPRGPEPAAAGAASVVEDGNFIVLGENPKWKPVRELFRTYQQREINGVANITLNNIASFIEKPIIQQTAPEEGAAGGTDEQALDLPDTCATKGDLDSYKLIILLTGIPEPKAVFLGTDQNRCEVVRGDAIGNKGARVAAITQYKVIIDVPGEEKSIERSLVPPLKGFGEADEEASDVP